MGWTVWTWVRVVVWLWGGMGAPLALAGSLQVHVQDSRGRPMADAAVYLESREARSLVRPLAGAELAQVRREFVPSVLVIPVGTPVSFPNRDTVRHHVYSFSLIKKFELKLYAGTPASPVLFDQPGVAVLGCNIHDNMAAWVVVVETPYYGRTGDAGGVLLDNVPAGSYRLRVWHPNLPVGAPALDQPATVTATPSVLTVRMTGLTP